MPNCRTQILSRPCWTLALCAGSVVVLAAAAPAGNLAGSGAVPFRAGAQVIDISPTKFPVRVNGMFTERMANKVVDRLFAKALALDDGSTRLVWCVVDSCMMPRDLIDAAKAEAAEATGLPASHMLVSATHTHSAPSAMGCLGSRSDPDYAAWLPGRIAQAIIGAVERRQPARVGWTVVDDWDHTFNRRWIRRPDRMLEDPFGQRNVRANMHPGHQSPDAVGPSGPVDPGLSLLAVETPDGKPLALFANYSQHYYGSELLSSDYFGRFAGEVAKKLGAGTEFVAAMSQGTSGDLASMDYSAPARPIGYEIYAEQIAARAVAAYRQITWHTAAPLKTAESTLELNYRVPDAARLAWARETVARLGDRLPQNHPEIYAFEAVSLHERQKTELKLQAMRIGELGVTAIPNEVYAITGLKLKALSPLIPTFNVSLANGAEGYIPPPEQHKLGGYTTWPARTAGLETGAEPRIVETVLGLLEAAAGKPRRTLAATHGPYARAILADRPLAYWRLDEIVTPRAHDASGHGHEAVMEDGLAVYLPGAGTGRAISPNAALTVSNFSDMAINRAVHFAGGRLRTQIPLGETFTAELWLWNGLPADARAVTGYFFSRGPDGDPAARGEHLGLGGTFRSDLTGKLILFNGNERQDILGGRTVLATRAWHHVVFVRDGHRVWVHLDGAADPEIAGEFKTSLPPGEEAVFFGGRTDRLFGWEGRLDEVALYSRALTPAEIAAHYRASGVTSPIEAVATAPEPAPASVALSPAESMRKTRVRAGYHLELAAAEPLTMDPVAIDWDATGRLWVVEMADYPNGMDGKGSAGGRVRVLEDENGDGRYDKSTLFADGLQMPTGLLTWRDGVLVTTAPEIIFLKDNDRDGRADVREVLYSGFQVGNPQLRVNGLRWGLDNWVYCAAGGHHGAYGVNTRIRSHRTGTEVLVGSRDTRVRPDTGELEPASGPSQFGRNRDEWGRWFGTQNSFPLWHYVLADHYLRRNPHVPAMDPVVHVITPKNPKIFPAVPPDKRYHSFDEAGHFTSGCSGMIYGDELLFPRSQESHAFACEPFHNLVHHELVSDDGVSFRARRAPEEQTGEIFASEDRWVRPVMTRTGPDGALWVVDMYRAMIEHPEWLPPEGRAELLSRYREGDDKGRIYRIVPDGARARQPMRLENLSVPELVAALDSPNVWQRDKIQQLLVWGREAGAVPELEKLARQSRNPLARLQALCTLDGLNALAPAQVEAALSDPHPGVRENALRLAETRGTRAVIAAASKLVSDPDAKVRLQLAFTLGEWKQPEAGSALGELAVANANDRHLVAAVMSSAVPHAAALVDAVVGSQNEALATLCEPLLKLSLALDHRDAFSRLTARLVTPHAADFSSAQMEAFGRLLDLLAQRKMSLADLAKGNEALSGQLAGVTQLFDSARRLANARDREPVERVAAASLLARDASRRGEALPLLTAWLAPQSPPDLQRTALSALTSTADDRVPGLLMQNWASLGPGTRSAILDQLLGREAWTLDLLDRIGKGEIAVTALDASRRSRLRESSSNRVRESAHRVLGEGSSVDRAKVIGQFRTALELKGDPVNGRNVFLLRCATCHRRDDAGNDLGPDLRSVTAHEPARLLTSILDPSADVQPGFQAYKCRLSGGEELYGIITAETATSLVLKVADATTRTLLRNDIAALECLNTSLMPEGLEAGMSAQDMADLIALLREK